MTVVFANVDQDMISDQRNFRAKYLQMIRKAYINSDLPHFISFKIIYFNMISNLLDLKLIDPGSNLIPRW